MNFAATPNMDGSRRGCIFCNNASFRPGYLSGESGITYGPALSECRWNCDCNQTGLS